MNIGDILVKPLWRRRQPPTTFGKRNVIKPRKTAMTLDNGVFHEYSQSDFLNELNPSAHLINSVNYRSMRPKYKYDTELKKNVEDGYDEVERISIAVQEGILRHKVTHTFGNPMWFGSEGNTDLNDTLVALHNSHWNMTGMTDALNAWGRALFGTGDAAIYLYRIDNKINYKVFSFEEGDVFTSRVNDSGETEFVRLFLYNNKRAVEIYGPKDISLWVYSEDGLSEEDKAILRSDGKEVSEDGYIRISKTSHGLSVCPVIYHRRSDVVWGLGQSTIEHIERLLSDLGENNKYYAYQILFLSGGVINLPSAQNMGKVIASKTTDGDAKILEPADASNTFTLDIEKNFDILWETTGTVVIEPKELKAGENSGAFIRNLYWREVQWSTNEIASLRPVLNQIISVFIKYVGMIEGKSSEFDNLKMSFLLEPYVPKNITEEITNIAMAKNAGITSVKTASGEIPFNNPREHERIKSEKEEAQALEIQKEEREAARMLTNATEAQAVLNIDNNAKS